ncbi:hypothetical protein PTKIN_Ptkin01aG0343200 [Pterospermum kingtungense]
MALTCRKTDPKSHIKKFQKLGALGGRPTGPASEPALRKPKPGDHIYMTTSDGHYHYHGIYVGDDTVIHVLGPPHREIGPSDCQKCRNKRKCDSDLIAKTCLDCFLDGRPLQFAEYGYTKPANEVVDDGIKHDYRTRIR